MYDNIHKWKYAVFIRGTVDNIETSRLQFDFWLSGEITNEPLIFSLLHHVIKTFEKT